MSTALSDTLQVPDFAVKFDGTAVAPEVRDRILRIRVSLDVDVADAFFIVFDNRGNVFTEEPPAELGAEVEIKMGYLDGLETLLLGQVMGWTPSFPQDGPATFTVRGYDLSHRLMRNRKVRTFLNIKDSDLASQIAGDHGLSAETDDSEVQHDHVFQNNLSDWNFLKDRARRAGFELFVQEKKLIFKKSRSSESAVETLEWGRRLTSFSPRLSASSSVTEVQVKSWDSVEKENILGKAIKAGESTRMEGAKTSSEKADATFGERKETLSAHPVDSQEAADVMAKSYFDDRGMRLLAGHGTCIGLPTLVGGSVLKIAGVGERFSGLYYVTRADHEIEAGRYTTRFKVVTNSLGKASSEDTPAGGGGGVVPTESETQEIEVTFKDEEGNAVSGIDYIMKMPNGEEREDTLPDDGTIRADNLPKGKVSIRFKEEEGEEGGGGGSDSSGGSEGESTAGGSKATKSGGGSGETESGGSKATKSGGGESKTTKEITPGEEAGTSGESKTTKGVPSSGGESAGGETKTTKGV